ncbi:MAG TPA: TraR/DksA C4-type zinc finger protein [Gemmatimonadales bacterium]|nr:TraR/DksA C4-type zinc finger protein [Gemmatimonadales bacterium]
MTATMPRETSERRALTRAQLAELRSVLEEELRRFCRSDGPPGAADALSRLEGRARDSAARIAEALRRMDGGTYGVCAACRSPISYERLSAIPEAALCVDCSHGRSSAGWR